MPIYHPKPRNARLVHRAGAPMFWALMDDPRRTFPGDSGDVADATGNVRAGTRSGGCTWATGPYGRCLSFDGTSGLLTLPVPTPASHPTIAMRVCPATSSPIGMFDSAPVSANTLRNYGADEIQWHPDAAGFGGLGLSAGVWYDLVFVFRYDTARRLDYYRDGRFVSSASTLVTADPTFAWTTFTVGGINSGSVGYYQGLMGDIRIYPRSLTPAEISRDFADPYWRFRPRRGMALLAATGGSPSPTTTLFRRSRGLRTGSRGAA